MSGTATKIRLSVAACQERVGFGPARDLLLWLAGFYIIISLFGAEDLTYSPAYAVGSYFIPFYCFWRPFQSMVELWKARVNPAQWRGTKAPLFLSWWWTFGLVSCITAGISPMRVITWDDALWVGIMALIANAAGLPSTALLIRLVSRIYNLQMTHAAETERWTPG